MALVAIPGYLAEVKIGSDQIEDNLGSGTLTKTRNVMVKSVAGTQEPTALAGLKTATISVSGHISVEDVGKFNTAFENNATIAFIWGIGDTTGTPDAGEYTGNMMVENFAAAFDADDEWTFTLDAIVDGACTYVAPV
jgi:hypothetical protein